MYLLCSHICAYEYLGSGNGAFKVFSHKHFMCLFFKWLNITIAIVYTWNTINATTSKRNI